jgi:hypothetical protein
VEPNSYVNAPMKPPVQILQLGGDKIYFSEYFFCVYALLCESVQWKQVNVFWDTSHYAYKRTKSLVYVKLFCQA